MTTISPSSSRFAGAPRLRLFAGGTPQQSPRPHQQSAHLRHARALDEPAEEPRIDAVASCDAHERPVLIAGGDATRRDAMVDEMSRTMACGTRFTHAAASWEVLAFAGSSSMVVLSGELGDVSSASLMRMLSHRYPALPVVSLDPNSLLSAA